MSGGLTKRSLRLAGHLTSLALEPEFWAVLEAESGRRGLRLTAFLEEIDARRGERGLASACRVAALAARN